LFQLIHQLVFDWVVACLQ